MHARCDTLGETASLFKTNQRVCTRQSACLHQAPHAHACMKVYCACPTSRGAIVFVLICGMSLRLRRVFHTTDPAHACALVSTRRASFLHSQWPLGVLRGPSSAEAAATYAKPTDAAAPSAKPSDAATTTCASVGSVRLRMYFGDDQFHLRDARAHPRGDLKLLPWHIQTAGYQSRRPPDVRQPTVCQFLRGAVLLESLAGVSHMHARRRVAKRL